MLKTPEYAKELIRRYERRQNRRAARSHALVQAVLSKWDLTEEDAWQYAATALQPSSYMTTGDADWDGRVYSTLLAWVRHHKTDYENIMTAHSDPKRLLERWVEDDVRRPILKAANLEAIEWLKQRQKHGRSLIENPTTLTPEPD